MKSVEESSLSCTSTSERRPSGLEDDDYKTAPKIEKTNVDKTLSTEIPFKKHESQEYITDQQAAESKRLEPCIS